MRAGRMLRTPALNREPVRVTYAVELGPITWASRQIHFWAAMLALARDCEEICFASASPPTASSRYTPRNWAVTAIIASYLESVLWHIVRKPVRIG